MNANNYDVIPREIRGMVVQETADMSDRDHMIFLRGLTLGLRCATHAMTETVRALQNSTPNLLDGPITVRRGAL